MATQYTPVCLFKRFSFLLVALFGPEQSGGCVGAGYGGEQQGRPRGRQRLPTAGVYLPHLEVIENRSHGRGEASYAITSFRQWDS